MADPQPDNKNLLWAMIAGAVVLLLVIYIFAGTERPVVPPPAPPSTAPAEAPASPLSATEPEPVAAPETPAPDAAAKPPP